MRYLLGIDGGGTRTRALLVTQTGEVVGRGEGGPANFLSVGLATAVDNIAQAVKQALDQSGAPQKTSIAENQPPIAHMALGLAGVGRPKDHAQMLAALQERFATLASRITLTTDAHIALSGAVEGQDGIVVIAGTGAIALGTRDGRLERAGGWGYLLDDRGSGYDLGRQAISAALRSFDGRGEATTLLIKICEHYQVAVITDLIGPIYQGAIDRARIAELTQSVLIPAAENGDQLAQQILYQGGQELALAVEAVARRLELTGKFKIAGTGGLLQNRIPYLYPVFATNLQQLFPEAEIGGASLEPVYGAVILAAEDETAIQLMIRRWKDDHEVES